MSQRENIPVISQHKSSCFRFWRSHKCQLSFVAIFPSIILAIVISLLLSAAQQECDDFINNFSDKLYSNQIESQKNQNIALTARMNLSAMKASWKLNILSSFWKKIFSGEVIQNTQYKPILINIQKTYSQTEDQTFQDILKKNPILVSSWQKSLSNKQRGGELIKKNFECKRFKYEFIKYYFFSQRFNFKNVMKIFTIFQYLDMVNPYSSIISFQEFQGYISLSFHLMCNFKRYHPDISEFTELDQIDQVKLNLSTLLDSLSREIKYQTLIDQSEDFITEPAIKDIFLGFEQDGLTLFTGLNTTFDHYYISSGCQFHKFIYDIRCRYYYQPTINAITLKNFPPQLLFSQDGIPFLGSIFCQKVFLQDKGNSILCITQKLSGLQDLMKKFTWYSKFQIIVDQFHQTMIYHSEKEIPQSSIINIWDFELKYLEDQSQALKFQQFLKNFGDDEILEKLHYIDFNSIFSSNDQTQKTFEYIRNGTSCFAIFNLVTMNDLIISPEDQVKQNAKYLKKGVFLFIDILAKDKLTIFAQDLQNQISQVQKACFLVSFAIIILAICLQLILTLKLSVDLQKPIIHLTQLLKSIQLTTEIKGQNKRENSNNLRKAISQKTSLLKQRDSIMSGKRKQVSLIQRPSIILENAKFAFSEEDEFEQECVFSLLAEQQWEEVMEDLCLSSDTQSLFNSFRNLFKILQFTTQRIFMENSCVSLLNLSSQIEHFKQFKNYRALGVCFNNMANIHYNCGRFKEAIENNQQAIICAQYELEIYQLSSEKEICLQNSSNINDLNNFEKDNRKRDYFLKKNLKNQNEDRVQSFIKENYHGILMQDYQANLWLIDAIKRHSQTEQYNNKKASSTSKKESQSSKKETSAGNYNIFSNPIKNQILINESCQQEGDNISKENSELWWNIFNRKFNLIKSLYFFMTQFSNVNIQMWEETEKVIKELLVISTCGVLPFSYKREMNVLYFLALSFLKQNKHQEFSSILIVYEELYKHYQKIKLKKLNKNISVSTETIIQLVI